MELGDKRDNTLDPSTELLLGRRRAITAFGLACLGAATPAAAQLTIEIVGGGTDQIPITIVPFGTEDRFAQHVSEIVSADLNRSGRFKLQDIGSVRPLPTEPAEVNFRYWKNRGNQTLVVGQVQARNDGRLEVRFRMIDTVKEAQLVGYSYTIAPAQLRAIAHKIADIIYEKLTGEPGVFSTRIAYVARNPDRFELQVADADGVNSQFILSHREPIISPAWSPDGTRIAYVSFEQRRPIVFLHNLTNGSRRVLANFEGINSAPAWFPDGPAARAHAVQGRAAADLPDQCGRQRRRTRVLQQWHRHRAQLLARCALDAVHLRPRRQPADLPHAGRRRQRRARHLRRHLQRHPALQPGREVLRIHPAQRRQVQPGRSWSSPRARCRS